VQHSDVEHAVSCKLSSDFGAFLKTGDCLVEPTFFRKESSQQKVTVTRFE
jgi:hypothetical protein